MASFCRTDYEKTFDFALTVFRLGQSLPNGVELTRRSVEIMDLCESVIGQVAYRPVESRETRPRRKR